MKSEWITNKTQSRLSEGSGEAIYEIGVDDDGTIKGVSYPK